MLYQNLPSPLCCPDPQDSQGNVERWLIECEIAMRDTIKHVTRQAFDAYAKTPRINWVTAWPGQVCAKYLNRVCASRMMV